MFQKDIFINLDKRLSVRCKHKILSVHMNKHGISLCDCQNRSQFSRIRCSRDIFETSNNSMKVCINLFYAVCREEYETQIGFPQACHLFCSNKNFTKQGKAYFTHASQGLVDEMNCLKFNGFDDKRTQYRYCILVYAAIKDTIDLDEIDESHFLNILSSIYQKDDKIKHSLLKYAVHVLEGTYISKCSITSTPEEIEHPKYLEKYSLQHNTIKEAVLISYGIDTDISPVCDFKFLQEYIRPKGYIDELNESKVLLFIDYKPLVKRLISMLSIDDNTCTGVGQYLRVISLQHRRDEILRFFFQNIKNVKPEQFTRLINGLTNFGKNEALVDFHPQLCRDVMMMHSRMPFILAFCRPIGWVDNDSSFVAMETDLLIKTLLTRFRRLDESGQLDERGQKSKTKYFSSFSVSEWGLGNDRYAVGYYVFKYLIVNNFVNIVELFLKNLKQNILQISPIDLKDFLDGLLYQGKRSNIVPLFKDFFEDVLFKYGSIPVITELCRPLTSTISSQNIIKIDDKLLAGKLSAYLESYSVMTCDLQTSTLAALRENGKYFAFWDYNNFEMNFINNIALYVSEHGFISNNEQFVRVMYAQFISDEKNQRNYTRPIDKYFINWTDEATNQEKTEEYCDVNGKKVVFDDYPGEELIVDAIGIVIQGQVKVGSIKKIYGDHLDDSKYKTTYSRLFEFLSDFKSMLPWSTPGTVIGLHTIKFECLFDDIGPEKSESSFESSENSDTFDFEIASNYIKDLELD